MSDFCDTLLLLKKNYGQPPFWYCNFAFAQRLGFTTPKFPAQFLTTLSSVNSVANFSIKSAATCTPKKENLKFFLSL
jgi:hypothetical protein